MISHNTSQTTQTSILAPFSSYHAVVGLITRDDEVLITERNREPLKGFWEYPGGKVETIERPLDALKRELAEEVGILVQSATPILSLNPRRDIWLLIYHVNSFTNEPCALEGQKMKWSKIANLNHIKFLPGNEFILPYPILYNEAI